MQGHKNKEVEVKLRVTDERALRRALAGLGARRLSRVHEMNTLYDTPRQTLRKRGQLLRLRLETPAPSDQVRPGTAKRASDTPAPRQGLLTYKGPSLRLPTSTALGLPGEASGQKYKVRHELEVVISNPVRLDQMLRALGLTPAFRYEKYRTSYALPRVSGLKLELDQTPVGVFVELEGRPRAIDRVAKLLGYGPADYITSSYLALYLLARRKQGLTPRDMLFRGRNPRRKS